VNGGGDNATDDCRDTGLKTAHDELAIFFHEHQPPTLRRDGSVNDQVRAVTEMLVPQVIAFDPEEEGCGGVGDQLVQIERLVFVAFGGRWKPGVDVTLDPLEHAPDHVWSLFGCQAGWPFSWQKAKSQLCEDCWHVSEVTITKLEIENYNSIDIRCGVMAT